VPGNIIKKIATDYPYITHDWLIGISQTEVKYELNSWQNYKCKYDQISHDKILIARDVRIWLQTIKNTNLHKTT